MLLNIYVYRDKSLSCYDKPFFEQADKEQYSTSVARSIVKSNAAEQARIKDLALYYLGQFDDIKGQFILLEKEEKLLDCEDFIPRKEVKIDESN